MVPFVLMIALFSLFINRVRELELDLFLEGSFGAPHGSILAFGSE